MQYEILKEISILWAMFHVIFLFIILFRSRYTKRKTILFAAVGMGIMMSLNMVLGLVFGLGFLGKIFFFTASIPSFVFFYFISADKKFRFLFTFCLADTVCLWIMAVTNLLDYYLGGGTYVLMLVSRLVAFPLVEYLAYRFLREPYLELQASVEKGWAAFSGITMLYYILLVLVVQYPANIVERPEDVPVCVLILILMFFNYEMMFSSLYRQLLLYRRQQSERILQEQKNFLEERLENQQHIRKLKHDMKGHAVTISGLLAAGKTQEALTYLSNVQGEMDAYIGQYCANPYINAVLGSYDHKFQELGTEFELDVRVGDEQIPYMELCQILSNGLENVKDALGELPQEQRAVFLRMKYNKGYLIIQIKNACSSALHVEKGAIPATSKKGTEHGFGLKSMLEAAQKLGGDMLCYTQQNHFIVDVMIRMKQL